MFTLALDADENWTLNKCMHWLQHMSAMAQYSQERTMYYMLWLNRNPTVNHSFSVLCRPSNVLLPVGRIQLTCSEINSSCKYASLKYNTEKRIPTRLSRNYSCIELTEFCQLRNNIHLLSKIVTDSALLKCVTPPVFIRFWRNFLNS